MHNSSVTMMVLRSCKSIGYYFDRANDVVIRVFRKHVDFDSKTKSSVGVQSRCFMIIGHKFVSKNHSDFFDIQETELVGFDDSLCHSLREMSKQVTGQGSSRKRDARRVVVGTSDRRFPMRMLDDDPTEEEEAPFKRKKAAQSSKGKHVPVGPGAPPPDGWRIVSATQCVVRA